MREILNLNSAQLIKEKVHMWMTFQEKLWRNKSPGFGVLLRLGDFGGNGLGVTKFEAGPPTHKPILVYPFHSLRPVDFQGGDGGAVQHSKNLSTTKIGTTSKRGGKHTRPPWRG